MSKCDFSGVVQVLDDMKAILTFRNVLRDYPSQYDPSLSPLVNKAEEDIKKLLQDVAKDLYHDDILNNEYTLRKGFAETCSETLERVRSAVADTDGEWHRGYGKYWNEVPLPACVEDFFIAYVNTLREMYYGMMGVEMAGMKIPRGASAITYYDLSDIAVVFRDREAMEAFEEDGNVVEPCDYMQWVGGGWSCC